jgi:hypothetical protein
VGVTSSAVRALTVVVKFLGIARLLPVVLSGGAPMVDFRSVIAPVLGGR